MRRTLPAAAIAVALISGRLASVPVSAGAYLRLTDGRVLEGREVRRDGDVYLLELDGGSLIPVPVSLVEVVGIRTGEPTPDTRPAPPPGLTYAEPQTLAGVPVAPPTTTEQLAPFGPPARFQPDIVVPNLGPSYWVPDPNGNEFHPSKWAKAPTDPIWRPTSAFDPSEVVLEGSPSTWQKGPVETTWVPQDGFKKSR